MSFRKQSGISSILIVLIIVGVLVGGGLIWYYQKTLQIISRPTPQITLQDETTDWKTYRNEKYGFEVKYPNFYYSEEDSLKKVWFFHQKSAGLSLPGASVEIIEKNINSVIQELKNQDPGITQVIEEKDITINDQSAKKLILTTAIGLNEIYYVLSKNNLTFLLSYREGIKDQLDILSTFKFIK